MDDARLAAVLDDAKTVGVQWIHVDLSWWQVQGKGSSSWNWSDYDRIVNAANARGLSLIFVLDQTPPWARSVDYGGWTPPADPSGFATFAAAAVRRYAPLGIHTWEIWNEPNNAIFWPPRAEPAAYTRLLELAAAAMRAADSQVFIVSGGLAPRASDGTNIAQLEFLASICAAGANHLVDALGYHPYSFPVTPQNPANWSAWAQIDKTTPSVETILSKYGTPSLPIWATEYGAPTDGPGIEATAQGYPAGSHPDHVDEAFQAEIATDSVRTALDTPGMSALFWFTDRDFGTDTSTNENFFGLRRLDGTAKPAYFALQSAIRQYGADSPTP